MVIFLVWIQRTSGCWCIERIHFTVSFINGKYKDGKAAIPLFC